MDVYRRSSLAASSSSYCSVLCTSASTLSTLATTLVSTIGRSIGYSSIFIEGTEIVIGVWFLQCSKSSSSSSSSSCCVCCDGRILHCLSHVHCGLSSSLIGSGLSQCDPCHTQCIVSCFPFSVTFDIIHRPLSFCISIFSLHFRFHSHRVCSFCGS